MPEVCAKDERKWQRKHGHSRRRFLSTPSERAILYIGKHFPDIAAGKDLKFWNVFGDVVLQKNVTLHGEYAWDIENTNAGYDDNAWSVSLNYAF